MIPPAITSLAFFALPHLLEAAFDAGVIGVVHPLTVAAFLLTIVLPVSAVISLAAALRWMTHPDRPRALALAMPTLFGVSFFGFAIWLGANGWIGLRTWAY